jgi:hypothetical protein
MGDDLEDDDVEEIQPDDQPRIARPPAPSAIPPLTLRGLGAPSLASPSPTPAPGSTGELESLGFTSHTAPRPIAPPTQSQSALSADQDEFQRLKTTGSGVSQIAKAHPVAGGILRGLGIVGSVASALVPGLHGVLSNVPGTEEHHSQLLRQQSGRIGEDLGEEAKETGIGEQQARTEHDQAETAAIPATTAHTQAETNALTNPQAKVGATPEETTIHDLMTGENGQPRLNPQTQKPFSYLEAYQAVKQAGQDAKPDKEETAEQQYIKSETAKGVPLETAIKNYAKITKTAPQEPGSYMPLYDEKGHVTGAWDPKSGRIAKPPDLSGTTTGGAAIASKADAATTKEAQPYQQMVDSATQAHELADMASKGNASADVDLVLSFFKMMKGTGGAGVRFTQQEQNMILGARNSGQDLLGIGQKVIGEGQALTPEQRKNMVAVIDMHAKAAQTHLDGMKSGKGGDANQGGAQPVYATNPKTKERVVSTDGGKTWNPAQ